MPSVTQGPAPRSLRRGRQGGFSLIEVLVSIIILTIGVLGTAGLMLASLRSNQSASFTSTAARLATEYQELMAMNTDVVNDTTSSGSSFAAVDTTGGYTATAPTACLSGTCTPTQLYEFMVYDWVKRVQGQLPGGVVKVCRDANPKDSNGLYKWSCTAPTGGTGLLTIKFGWGGRSDVGEGTFSQAGSDASPPRFVVTLYGSQQDIVNCSGASSC